MTEWYQDLIANLWSNIQSLTIAVAITIVLWISLREMNRLFAWLRLKKNLRLAIVNVIESMVRYIVKLLVIMFIILDFSFPFGFQDIALRSMPHFVIVGVAFIMIWSSVNALKVVFDWVRTLFYLEIALHFFF